jgi:hypothetical protein
MSWHDRTRRALASWGAVQDPREAERPSPPTKYVCLHPGCGWHGWEALEHHRASADHHPIGVRNAPHWGPVKFGCCHDLDSTDAPPARQDEECPR